MNPHQVTKDFEAALCEYTGAPFAVCVNSCTMALTLALEWQARFYRGARVSIPRRTYISVPIAARKAGLWPVFRDEDWSGAYRLDPYAIWDSARWFTSGLFNTLTRSCTDPAMVCVSFHASKTLGLEQGGAILHNDAEADPWLRRARFDGRTEGVAPKDDKFDMIGWHAYMNPSTAAQGLLRLYSLPKHNAPLANDPYPDLSTLEIFK